MVDIVLFFGVRVITVPLLDDPAIMVLIVLYPILLGARLLFRIKDLIQF